MMITVFVVIMLVGMLGGIGWLAVTAYQIGPEGIAAAIGHFAGSTVKNFNDANH